VPKEKLLLLERKARCEEEETEGNEESSSSLLLFSEVFVVEVLACVTARPGPYEIKVERQLGSACTKVIQK
jgi:hypothetical protein